MVASTLWLLIPIIVIFGTAFICFGLRFCCQMEPLENNDDHYYEAADPLRS